ncbi:hypothetical protein CPB84DRAFT_1746062 [Gymnopilus junonius]|uniref:Uncharacterized protein n=1 Tax=Gymnopilus junonius TaxID=109634 RepID=A0A9P5NP27_GYMJU|nr:hypothetical protein CPB84DRAFT_1746062 [Gymnopilus junonius]
MPNTRAKNVVKADKAMVSPSPASNEHKDGQEQVMIDGSQAQPHRGRGHPKKMAGAEAHANQESAPIEAAPHKRSHKEDESPIDIEGERSTKRAKANSVDENQPPQDKANGACKVKTIAPQDNLPDQKGRNVNPVPKTTIRHTSQELEEAKCLLAETNVLEDIQNDTMDIDHPKRLSAAIRKRQHAELEDSGDDGEVFDFEEVDDMSISSESEEPVKDKPARRGKAVKGALRRQIQAMEGKIQEEEGGRERKKIKPTNNNFPSLDTAPKTYRNSGLCKEFKSKKVKETFDPLASGGLDDEDALSTRPAFPHQTQAVQKQIRHDHEPSAKDLKRDNSRTNDLVKVQENGGLVAPAKTKQKAPKAARATRSASQSTTQVTGNAAQGGSEQFLKDPCWTRVFLPSLTHALYISREPFKHFTADSPEFLATIQQVFNRAFPNIQFALSSNDKLTVTAYNRIKARKSKLAIDVLGMIKKFFDGHEFTGQLAAIPYYAQTTKKDETSDPNGFLESPFIAQIAKRYLVYASNSVLDPPISWKDPPISWKDPPISRKDPPKGLYALIMTAESSLEIFIPKVERAFIAHMRGTYVEPGQFNHDNCWNPMAVFFGHIDKVSEDEWRSILQFNGVGRGEDAESDVDNDALRADQSMISAFRAGLYCGLKA